MVAMRACARSRSVCALPSAGAPPPMPCRADRGDGLVSYIYMDIYIYTYIYIHNNNGMITDWINGLQMGWIIMITINIDNGMI